MSVFDRDETDGFTRGDRALIVFPDFGRDENRDSNARLEEAAGLAEAIGIEVVEKRAVKMRQTRPATLFGKGQVEQLATETRLAEADLAIIDASAWRTLKKMDATVVMTTSVMGYRESTPDSSNLRALRLKTMIPPSSIRGRMKELLPNPFERDSALRAVKLTKKAPAASKMTRTTVETERVLMREDEAGFGIVAL